MSITYIEAIEHQVCDICVPIELNYVECTSWFVHFSVVCDYNFYILEGSKHFSWFTMEM